MRIAPAHIAQPRFGVIKLNVEGSVLNQQRVLPHVLSALDAIEKHHPNAVEALEKADDLFEMRIKPEGGMTEVKYTINPGSPEEMQLGKGYVNTSTQPKDVQECKNAFERAFRRFVCLGEEVLVMKHRPTEKLKRVYDMITPLQKAVDFKEVSVTPNPQERTYQVQLAGKTYVFDVVPNGDKICYSLVLPLTEKDGVFCCNRSDLDLGVEVNVQTGQISLFSLYQNTHLTAYREYYQDFLKDKPELKPQLDMVAQQALKLLKDIDALAQASRATQPETVSA